MIIEGFGRGSLLEDPTWSEDLQKSFCFSPEYECEMMATDHLLEDVSLDFQSISSNEHSMETSIVSQNSYVSYCASSKLELADGKAEIFPSIFSPMNQIYIEY